MKIEKPKSSPPVVVWFFGLLVTVAIGVAIYQNAPHQSAPIASTLPPLEIANFTGQPETYVKKEKKWVPLQRGTIFEPDTRIRTDAKSEVDLHVENQVTLRLKENSELERKPILSKSAKETYRLHLVRGLVLGATEKKAETEKWLEVSTPAIVASIRGTIFVVKSDESSKKSWVGVLRGNVEVASTVTADKIFVQDLQKIESNPDGTLSKPMRVSQDEWNEMKEAYELIQKSAAQEAEQLDLSLEAGGLFKNVFDHGTFFTPKVGYAWRNFEKNKDGKVILSIEYDVFPRGSYVGMYMKIRDLDLADYEGLQMKVSRVPETGYPDTFKIEIKSKGQVVRAFTPKAFKKEWQTMRFPFRTTKETPVSEVTFVFSNEKVGEFTRGALQFSDIQLLPKPPEPQETQKASAVKAPEAAKPATPPESAAQTPQAPSDTKPAKA